MAITSMLDVLVIGVAGLSALYVYRRTRRGQVRVGISASYRLIRGWNPGRALLIVRLRIANTSSVIYWHREATATLMDARREIERTGQIHLAPFSQADPFPAVYGQMDVEPPAVREGRLFSLDEDVISLEPGEFVESEVAFPLDEPRLGLMAMRVLMRGTQRRWLRPPDYWWGAFFYIDPSPSELESLSEEGVIHETS